MKQIIVLIALCMMSSSVFARSLYEESYLDCIDYGHSQPSPDEIAKCKSEAKADVLADRQRRSDYLDCVDYFHSPKTETQIEQCLIEASTY